MGGAHSRRFAVSAALLIASCFDPDIQSGTVACGRDGACPPGLVCDQVSDRCVSEPGDPFDASQSGDGPTPDAVPGTDGSTAFCDPADVDLAACYQFEGDAVDGSMYENDGQTVGVEFVAGFDGLGLRRDPDALDTQISVMESQSLAELSQVSVELWVNPASLPATRESVLVDKGDQYRIDITPDGEPRASITTSDGTEHLVTANDSLTVGTWTHLALTYNGASLLLYIDGNVVLGPIVSDDLGQSPGAGMTLLQGNPSGDPFVGVVDRLRIWRDARDADEICAEAGC